MREFYKTEKTKNPPEEDIFLSSASDHFDELLCKISHIFSGLSGISISLIPSGASASSTALTLAGGSPMQPASPTPFAPSGLKGEGVSMRSVINSGTCVEIGKA